MSDARGSNTTRRGKQNTNKVKKYKHKKSYPIQSRILLLLLLMKVLTAKCEADELLDPEVEAVSASS